MLFQVREIGNHPKEDYSLLSSKLCPTNQTLQPSIPKDPTTSNIKEDIKTDLIFLWLGISFTKLKMEDFSFLVGIIGNIVSIIMFLSPVKTFWRIVRHRSTEDFESLPYICTLLNCSLWTYYGIIKPGEYLVATINGFGIVVEIVYVILFLLYAPTKMRAKTAILVGILDVGFLAAAILVTQLALQEEIRINALGFLGAGINVIMYVSPLAAMKTVVTTKSVEYMPFLLSFFLCLNGGVWTFYAFLVRDDFLAVPNGIGFVLGIAQLVLYAVYRRAKPSTTNVSADPHAVVDEGWLQESLITAPN